MHGLSQIHLQSRGVVFRVKMAEDVLYNEIIKVIIVIIAAYFDAYVLYSYRHMLVLACMWLLNECIGFDQLCWHNFRIIGTNLVALALNIMLA